MNAVVTDTATNSDDDSDFEEAYVYLSFDEFDGLKLFREETKIELKGLESDNPTCVVYGAQFKDGKPCNLEFSGKSEVSLGSRVFFPCENIESIDSNKSSADNHIKISNSIVHFSLSHIQNCNDSTC